MKFLKKSAKLGYFAALMMVMFGVQAFAYLDPGTLTYVISMVAGLFIAGTAALAIFRRKIKLFFQNLGKKKDNGTAQVQDIMEDVVNPMDIDPMAEDQ